MRWNDIEEIAEALEDSHPDEDVVSLRLGKIHRWVIELLDFDDDPSRTSDRILEAIHNAWIEIRDEND